MPFFYLLGCRTAVYSAAQGVSGFDFLDINLPDRDGVSIINWIKDLRADVTIVMFSSQNSLDNIEHSIARGATGFIAKPFLKEQILYYVHQCSDYRP